jgi:hypothetical protein
MDDPAPNPVPTHPSVRAFAEAFAAEVEGAASIEVTVHDPGTDRYPWGTSMDGHVLLTVSVSMERERRSDDGEWFRDGRAWEGSDVIPADAGGNPADEPARVAGRSLGRVCARETASLGPSSGGATGG